MKTITLNLYEYSELSDKAKDRALRDFVQDHDDPLMQSHMINLLKEKLDERGIKYDEDSIDVFYSLSSRQGDGFMFEGDIEWRGRTIRIKHEGHYYHKYSRTMEVIEGEELSDTEMSKWEEVYGAVCDEMEELGYKEIEYQTSAEYFEEQCDAYEWTFEEDGKMRNV